MERQHLMKSEIKWYHEEVCMTTIIICIYERWMLYKWIFFFPFWVYNDDECISMYNVVEGVRVGFFLGGGI